MGQDKREIPRQSNPNTNIMQTPEKSGYAANDIFANQNSGPSPTAEKLSQILSGSTAGDPQSNGAKNQLRNSADQMQKGPQGFEQAMNQVRGSSNTSKGSVNVSHGSMNYS